MSDHFHVTRTQLEQIAEYRNDRQLETVVYSPLLHRDVDLSVYFDDGTSEISQRQLQAVKQFVELTEGLEHIKSELYAHWDNGSDCFDFVCDNADHAFANARLTRLLVNSKQYWGELPCSMLRFAVAWDEEHGAGIFILNGRLSHVGDSFDWPLVDS